MQIKYLGTAAAEGWPALFCECDNCKRAREGGGRNIRTRSQALIDNCILIDFPPDTFSHTLYNGLDLSCIRNCLITHDHSDHLYAEDIGMLRKGFAHTGRAGIFRFFGTSSSGLKISSVIDNADLSEDCRASFTQIRPFESFNVAGYDITPLEADHSADTFPVIYSIGKGSQTILYANDTGIFPESTWDHLRRSAVVFDFVSLDCTAGLLEGWRNGHMGLDSCTETANRLKEQGNAGRDTVFCVNHFSHNGMATYDELIPIAGKMGFIVSYDGMTVDF